MDGASAATTILQIIKTGISASLALYQYGASVKNAEKSLQKLMEEITTINKIANNAEEFVRKLDKKTAPADFCQYWIAEHSPAMGYKKTLDELTKTLSHNHGRSLGMKVLKRLKWPCIEPQIKGAIEAFERYIPYLELSLVLDNTDTLNEVSNQAARHHAILAKLEDSAADISKKVDQQHTTVTLLKDSIDIRSSLMRSVAGAADASMKIEQQREDSKCRDELKGWMDALDCTIKYESTLSQRQANTCQWLFDLDKYSDWCSSQNALLWVHGKPGAGKSVLISAVIERLSEIATDGSVHAYFYCDFRTGRSTHAFEVIRSLFTQLLRQSRENWLPLFNDLVVRKSNDSPPPVDLEMLYQLLLRALQLHAGDRPVLVIDALDECRDYVQLVKLLERLHKEGDCRLLATSRPLPNAPKAFRGLPNIDLHDMGAETLCDMRLHVEKEVAKHDKLMPFRDKIVPSLLTKADGMFRWVQLQLDRLTRCRTQGDIRTVLDTLPTGLYETYDRILTEVNQNEFDRRLVTGALLWLVGSMEKLGLRGLVEAVTFDLENSDSSNGDQFLSSEAVLDVCGSLVSYNKESDTVSLSHFSVKEYLLDERLSMGPLGEYHLSSSIVNNHLAKLCLDYLRKTTREPHFTILDLAKCNTFQEYVCRVGLLHLDHVMEIKEHLPELMQSLDAYQAVRRACPGMEPYTTLNIVVYFGTPWLLKMYLERNAALRPADIQDGHSPLVYAIARDKVDSATILLGWGLNIKHRCPNIFFELDDKILQPLHAAVVKKNATMVDLLLSHGCFIPPNILHLSFQSGVHASLGKYCQVIYSLLEYAANSSAVTDRGDNLLHVLLSRKDAKGLQHSVAEALVNAGCNPVAKSAIGATPLCLALLSQNAPLVDYFLDKGACFEDYRYLHLVDMDWARGLSWYHSAIAAANAAEHALAVMRSITHTDVSQVHMMLQRFKLPSPIVEIILDFAEYWACCTTIEGGSNSSAWTFVFRPPAAHGQIIKVQQIEFNARSNRWYLGRMASSATPPTSARINFSQLTSLLARRVMSYSQKIGSFGKCDDLNDAGISAMDLYCLDTRNYTRNRYNLVTLWNRSNAQVGQLLARTRPGDTFSFSTNQVISPLDGPLDIRVYYSICHGNRS
ncbi:hypothetical protein BU15DRAFT_66236 [Melanogaster broomeanus]|nr:hypothetical protein BU15DRAFT_66236 [Melanogaster broomeanus]